MSEEEILRNFVGILEDHFPEANTFRPRDIRLDKFVYVNDEEMDKRARKSYQDFVTICCGGLVLVSVHTQMLRVEDVADGYLVKEVRPR